ncbi:MAG: hypothetical protein L3J07_01880 [Candidatus Magasanikbacteria bacterium]|nr:hypothetical protein [Candidatus Magasanikbacteria bacterium]
MIDKNFIEEKKERMTKKDTERREIIKQSGDALHLAKRAIFSLHRDDAEDAEDKMKESENIMLNLQKKFDINVLEGQGSYKAGMEEFVEATLFFDFINGVDFGRIQLDVPDDVYIAGLCDVPGELLRYAVKFATKRDFEMVERCVETAQEVVGELIEFNLTSYLRNKLDQAKNAVRKLEQVNYELSLRK